MNHPDSKVSKFDSIDSPKRESRKCAMASIAKVARGLSLAVVMASMGVAEHQAYAASTETAKSAEPWIGQSFPCYASDKKEAETVAAETFRAKYGKTPEQAGVKLAIDFNESTGRAMVKVNEKTPKTETVDVQSFPCYASDKKEAETVAAETFRAKYGKTPEQAGVKLAIDFNENTGRAMVTAKKKESSDLFTSERRGGETGTKVDVNIDSKSKGIKAPSIAMIEVPAPVSHMPEVRKETAIEEPPLEIGTRAQNAEFNKKIMKLIMGSYERILKRDPTLKGKLIVRFVIQKNGSVGNIKFGKIKGGLENEDLEKAIREKIGGLKFKPQEEEQPIELPINLAPKN